MENIRKADICRKTKETDIKLQLEILQNGACGSFKGTSGIGFFDHMLCAFATHGGFNITLEAKGDLEVDCHHTIEDIGIVLGQAFCTALKDKCGIARFADLYIPMDEALCFCAVDVSGRPLVVFDAQFSADMIGQYDTQMTKEFFRALAFNAGFTLHLKALYGENDHHITEAMYKACARALSKACAVCGNDIMSSKGTL